MNLNDKVKKAQFFLRNRQMNKWRKYEFDFKHYISYSQKWLLDYNFKTVIDIGANVGQSGIALSLAYPNANVHSFEPLPDCFAKLEVVANKIPNLTAHCYALGNEPGEVSFERNEYSPSSSLLKIADKHKDHFPNTRSVSNTVVPVVRLDDYASQLHIQENILVKIDVQGYETQVIVGAKQTLKRSKVVIVETSFEILYNDQPLFNDVYALMINLGFIYAGSFDQLKSPINNQVLQQDAIFVRI